MPEILGMKDKKDCAHLRFHTEVKVARITETEGGPVKSFSMECKLHCEDCGQQFEFIGLPGGYDPTRPTTNIDFTELIVPVRPATGNFHSNMKYVVDGPKDDKKPN